MRKRATRCKAINRRLQTSTRPASRARRPKPSTPAKFAGSIRGESTTFLVLQRQVQLAQGRGLELRAQTQLNQSVVELQRVDGTILSNNGVNLQTLGTQTLAH